MVRSIDELASELSVTLVRLEEQGLTDRFTQIFTPQCFGSESSLSTVIKATKAMNDVFGDLEKATGTTLPILAIIQAMRAYDLLPNSTFVNVMYSYMAFLAAKQLLDENRPDLKAEKTQLQREISEDKQAAYFEFVTDRQLTDSAVFRLHLRDYQLFRGEMDCSIEELEAAFAGRDLEQLIEKNKIGISYIENGLKQVRKAAEVEIKFKGDAVRAAQQMFGIARQCFMECLQPLDLLGTNALPANGLGAAIPAETLVYIATASSFTESAGKLASFTGLMYLRSIKMEKFFGY